jgi:hypothetical protein
MIKQLKQKRISPLSLQDLAGWFYLGITGFQLEPACVHRTRVLADVFGMR